MTKRTPPKGVAVVNPLASSDVTAIPPTTTIATIEPEIIVKVTTSSSSARPVPESEQTPDQRRIRQLEDQLAREQGRKDPGIEYEAPAQPGAETIIIHFLEDGFTALGQLWYRGQELEFDPNGQSYKDTFDRNGRSWLELRSDEFGQVEKYGRIMFRTGPWPGKSFTEVAKLNVARPLRAVGSDEPVQPPTAEELEAAQRAEERRLRAAPRLPVR